MNLYPEQLRFAAKVCEALNAINELTDNGDAYIGSLAIMVENEMIGECRDDDGGYSFHPVAEKKA